jgi:hypothetical protein
MITAKNNLMVKRWITYSIVSTGAWIIFLILSTYLPPGVFGFLITTGSPLVIVFDRVGITYLFRSPTSIMLIIAFVYYLVLFSIIFLPMLFQKKFKTRIIYSLVLIVVVMVLIAYCNAISI